MVALQVENTDTFLAEVAGMVSIHSGSHVGKATGITSTSGVLAMLADTAASAAD